MSTEKINVPVTVPSLAIPDPVICVTSNAIVWMATMKRMTSAVSLIIHCARERWSKKFTNDFNGFRSQMPKMQKINVDFTETIRDVLFEYHLAVRPVRSLSTL